MRIDQLSPTCEVVYSTTGNTNQNVEASLVNCSEPIVGITGHTFTGNGNYTFEFTDLLGNPGSTVATVSWIDKSAVSCAISYDIESNTNQDVVASLTGCNKSVTVTNNGGLTEYTFTGNGNFTFEYEDAYGNTGSTLATVSWIDKDSPEAVSVIYSPSGNTNQPVIVTLITNKSVQTITGWTG